MTTAHVVNTWLTVNNSPVQYDTPGWGGGGLPYKSDTDARQKIQIKSLRETNVGVAQA